MGEPDNLGLGHLSAIRGEMADGLQTLNVDMIAPRQNFSGVASLQDRLDRTERRLELTE